MLLEKFLIVLFSDLSVLVIEASLEIALGGKFISKMFPIVVV
jgi:hypothetical protein